MQDMMAEAAVRPTVRLDPAMRALFRAWRNGGPGPEAADAPSDPPPPDVPAACLPDLAPEPGSGTQAGAGTEDGADTTGDAPGTAAAPLPGLRFAPVRLRCDGRRPLRFQGARLASERRDSLLPGLGQEIDLWLLETGAVAVRVAFLVPDPGPVWPQHHAAIVDSAEAMAAFLASIDPAASLPGPVMPDPDLPAILAPGDVPDLVRGLRAGFRVLTQSLCATVPGTCPSPARTPVMPEPALP